MNPMPSRRFPIGKMRVSSAQVTNRHIRASLGVSNKMNRSESARTAMPLVGGHSFGLWAWYHSHVYPLI